MKISLRVAKLLGDRANERGLLAEIERECRIERHTVVSWLNNKARYVSLDALGQMADYLVKQGVDRDQLPGALLGRDAEYFWEAPAACKRLHFCLGTHTSPQWRGSTYVMSSDALLQGQMLTEISNRVYATHGGWATDRAGGGLEPGGSEPAEPRGHRDQAEGQTSQGLTHGSKEWADAHSLFPEFHLLAAPERTMTAENLGENWESVKSKATQLYDEFRREPSSALIALGSIKANPLAEVILAKAFSAVPFVSQDDVARPRERKCPILFRYRDEDDPSGRDPQPPACCGGLRLAAKTPTPLSGIYYETKTGVWEGCPCDLASDDVAFLFYSYRPSNEQVEVACGGFSARATMCLTRKLTEITGKLGKPQFNSESLRLGLYLIKFSFDRDDKNYTRDRDDRDYTFRVIELDGNVLHDRLDQRQTTRTRATTPAKKPRRKRKG